MRLQKIRFLTWLTKNIERSRITLVLADNGNKTAEFWLIPPGVSYPYVSK